MVSWQKKSDNGTDLPEVEEELLDEADDALELPLALLDVPDALVAVLPVLPPAPLPLPLPLPLPP